MVMYQMSWTFSFAGVHRPTYDELAESGMVSRDECALINMGLLYLLNHVNE